MSENPNLHEESSASGLGPGDRLQAARISHGFTLADVANKMHLSEAILTSLEENNFDEITAPIFVKGYLRSYARIVNVSEDDIIQQYASYYTDGDPPISSTSNTSSDINSDDARVKWITWLIIIGLIVLLAAWWWNRYQQPTETVSLDSSESSETITGVTQEKPTDNSMEIASDQQPEVIESIRQDVQAELQQSHTRSGESQQEMTAGSDTPVAAEEADSSPVVLEQEESVVSKEVEIPEPVDRTPVLSEPTPVEPVKPASGLVVTVNADTWTDIRDSRGKKLVYDLLRSGETVNVEGNAPYRAFFGNGYGVSLTYQGKDIDLKPVIKADNTAKISIGQ